MGIAAYNRGSRTISTQIDRSLTGRRTTERCGGKFFNGPGKRYVRCARCGSIDYEANEGDRCLKIIEVERKQKP